MTRRRRIEIPNPKLLRHHLEQESDPTVRLRLVLLNLVAESPRSLSLAPICTMVAVPEPTASVWVRAWRERGDRGVCHPSDSGGEPGRTPSRDDGDLAAMKSRREARPCWQIRAVLALIREHVGVTRSESQVSRILREKLGMRFGKPSPYEVKRPGDAEAPLEQRLIDADERLRAQGLSDAQIALGFLDEASPQLSANTARIWHFGHGQLLKNTARLQANAIGFYALISASVQDFLPRSNQTAIAECFPTLRAANADYRAIIVILDNSSSHRAAEVQKAAQEHAIELAFLPPSAPDLNPIEFIWKTVNRVISVNFIGSLDELKRHIRVAFNQASQYCSYARDWMERFVPHVLGYKELCG